MAKRSKVWRNSEANAASSSYSSKPQSCLSGLSPWPSGLTFGAILRPTLLLLLIPLNHNHVLTSASMAKWSNVWRNSEANAASSYSSKPQSCLSGLSPWPSGLRFGAILRPTLPLLIIPLNQNHVLTGSLHGQAV